MTTEPKPAPPMPVCPYCLTNPMILNSIVQQIPEFVLLLVFCGNPECSKLWNVEVLGPTRQMQQPRIVRPS
jgi:hypothetical protein